MAALKSLCVYCGSSHGDDRSYIDLAAELGDSAARRGIEIVFGGGQVGLMGVLADAAMAAGGTVRGIIPEHLLKAEVEHNGITRLEVVDTMHTRKRRMCDLADAFCTLPGGIGTLDETFEIITWKQLRLHDKPIVILNHGGYWDPLLHLIRHQVAANFVHPRHAELFSVVASVTEVFEAIDTAPAPATAGDIRRI